MQCSAVQYSTAQSRPPETEEARDKLGYWQQGDHDFYTPEMVVARAALRDDADVLHAFLPGATGRGAPGAAGVVSQSRRKRPRDALVGRAACSSFKRFTFCRSVCR